MQLFDKGIMSTLPATKLYSQEERIKRKAMCNEKIEMFPTNQEKCER